MLTSKWTLEEEELLRKDLTLQDLVDKLGRSESAIRSKARREGIKLKSRYHTEDSVNALILARHPHLIVSEYSTMQEQCTVTDTRCGHAWKSTADRIINRHIGLTCPECHNSNRKKTTESFFSSLVKKGYTTITSIGEYLGSKKNVEVTYCCGHTDSVLAGDLLNKGTKSTCKVCSPAVSGALKSGALFLQEVSNIAPDLKVLESYVRDDVYLKVQGPCTHEWRINPHNFLQKSTLAKCPVCYPPNRATNTTSRGEKELLEYIKSIYSGWVIENDRTILQGSELDIVLPDIGLAIEFNGDYWHSDAHKDSRFHLNKTEQVKSNIGYTLWHVFEHEWNNKQDIVKSKLACKLGAVNKIYARKCVVKKIKFPGEFLDATHLQGRGAPTSINYGLFLGEDLVAVMTFGPARFNLNYEYELVRYSSALFTQVLGGASKLLHTFLAEYQNPTLISYCDRRYSEGTLYEKLGMRLLHVSNPGYFYVSRNDKMSRYAAQKHKLKDKFPEVYDESKTEAQIMKELRYHKIYDCGNLVYTV